MGARQGWMRWGGVWLLLTACQPGLTRVDGSGAVARPVASSVPLPEGPASARPGQAAPDLVISVQVGQTFNVTLVGIPTAGYRWELQAGFDPAVVKLLTRRLVERDPGQPPLVGGTTPEVFELQALAAGTTRLTFLNYRPWEGPQQAVETRVYEVTVR
ncbi:MAG: protease inhibitor I42 family protein [Candidatus Sericytochromatia bacterium]|nr:protease inhibitor I42 family protein [Candidatus Sericytochromatia bacterium]